MIGYAPPTPRRPPTALRVLLTVVLGVHAIAAGAQPVLAGAYLSGSVDAVQVHAITGSLLVLVCLAQLLPTVLLWRPGRGPGWPALVTIVLLVAESVQLTMGYTRTLAVHVPLGVAIVAATAVMFVWSLVRRPAPSTGPAE